MTDAGARASDGTADVPRAVELYARAVALLRRAHGQISAGDNPADALWTIAACIARGSCNPAFSLSLALSPAQNDDAARAVESAFLAVRAARLVGGDERALAVLALAALLVDAGRVRLAAGSALDLSVFRDLPDDLDELAPAASAALGVSAASTGEWESAALIAFEVAWLERARLGPLHAGELPPRRASVLLASARELVAAVAPANREAAVSPFDALRRLHASDIADEPALAALSAVLGSVPPGTLVEHAAGEWAVVGPEPGMDPDGLVTWTVLDARGRAPAEPGRLEGSPVSRVVEPAEARFNPIFPLLRAAPAATK
jgi:hypothetical protein